MIRITAGDSYWKDISRSDGYPLDENWSGSWVIVSTLGGSPKASGSLTLSEDLQSLQLRISSSDTAIAPGDYILVVEVANSTLGYSSECIKDPLRITVSSID